MQEQMEETGATSGEKGLKSGFFSKLLQSAAVYSFNSSQTGTKNNSEVWSHMFTVH